MKILAVKQKENTVKWIEALLSGKYKQTKSLLGDESQGFCCWGLGCFIVDKGYDPEDSWDDKLFEYLGFNNKEGHIVPHIKSKALLALLNDQLELSFEEIGKYLIKYAKNNFRPPVAKAIKKHFSYVDFTDYKY